ncbi:hypothetical protein CK203_075438 [Vitis vinifera]|uniref:Integrase catalytic domain-containing protein n=1 Tax=Vitis vinifera TaxID=29760 RepID=A0A438EUG9_VITVI|nr:hypothetical protein CK203_075438 [Vitis vinifera]
MLLLCLDRASADRVMREVHAGVCGPHMGGHMLAQVSECQIHGDLIHVPPSELHALTSPWPFSVWGIDIIGKISPKSSSGHEFILVAIDYFTKWVEAASYARLTSSGVASFIRSHIICRYGVPHEPQTNGAVEAANKNIKRILRRMVETSRDWSEKLPFALWAYRTSFRTSTGATPYSLVYGMEAMLPVEIEMGSLRVALEQQIPEADWAQARFDQLNLLDERRLRATDHVRAYQRKMARAFKKRVKPRPLHVGDLVLKVIRGLIRDLRGKFKPNWSGPYFIRELTLEGAAWLMDLDGNRFSEPTNVDQLKRSDSVVFGLPGSFMDPHGLAPSSLTGCSSRRGHDRYLTEPLRSTQPGPHFSTLGCHHASPFGRYILDMCLPCLVLISWLSDPFASRHAGAYPSSAFLLGHTPLFGLPCLVLISWLSDPFVDLYELSNRASPYCHCLFVWGIPPLSFTFGHPPTVISFGASPHCHFVWGFPPLSFTFGASPHCLFVWGIPPLSFRLGHPPTVIYVWGIPPLSFSFGASPHGHFRLGHPPRSFMFGASPPSFTFGASPTVLYVWVIPPPSFYVWVIPPRHLRLGHPPLGIPVIFVWGIPHRHFRLGHPPTVIFVRGIPTVIFRSGHPPTVIFRLGHPPPSFTFGASPTVVLFRAFPVLRLPEPSLSSRLGFQSHHYHLVLGFQSHSLSSWSFRLPEPSLIVSFRLPEPSLSSHFRLPEPSLSSRLGFQSHHCFQSHHYHLVLGLPEPLLSSHLGFQSHHYHRSFRLPEPSLSVSFRLPEPSLSSRLGFQSHASRAISAIPFRLPEPSLSSRLGFQSHHCQPSVFLSLVFRVGLVIQSHNSWRSYPLALRILPSWFYIAPQFFLTPLSLCLSPIHLVVHIGRLMGGWLGQGSAADGRGSRMAWRRSCQHRKEICIFLGLAKGEEEGERLEKKENGERF